MANKNIFTRLFGSTKTESKQLGPQQTEVISAPESKSLYGAWHPIINRRWDGEKTPGELGAVSRNLADHVRLRYRSYDAADKIDTVKTITGKYFKYIVGSGLKLNAQPNKVVLGLEGINENYDDFIKHVEARFNVWANSKFCSQDKQKDLHDLASNGFSTAFLGGDVLVICRLTKHGLTVQVVDGEHVQTPYFENDYLNQVKERGNFCTHGIEHDVNGEHVGYFVKSKSNTDQFAKFEYIKAKGEKTGRVFAWMVYGSKQRADHHRGIPAISSILEKVNKLDRYTEAAVGKAEEAANVIMAIKHSADSTGENPFQKVMQKKLNAGDGEPAKSSYDLADGLANRITQTTSKTAVNLPIGSELSSYDTDIESSFGDFHGAIFDGICASMDMPPEVALMKYNSNYSASRAAIGAWQYVTDITRDNYSKNFYKRIYSLWLEIEILNNRINAPGFIAALNKNDIMTIEAYSTCRFIGKKMPHIDPLKEVKAARAILGDEKTPLASYERVTEDLNLGEFDENYAKNLEERKTFEHDIEEKTEPPSEPSPGSETTKE
jgi:capsid protein